MAGNGRKWFAKGGCEGKWGAAGVLGGRGTSTELPLFIPPRNIASLYFTD